MNSGDQEENAVGAQLMFVIVIIFQPSQTSNELKSVSSTEFVIAITCPASMHHYSSKWQQNHWKTTTESMENTIKHHRELSH